MFKRALRFVAPILLTTLVLAACGGSDSAAPSAESDTGATPASQAVDRSATIRLAVPIPLNTLDPQRSTSNTNLGYLTMIYDRLVDQEGTTLKIVPALATRWDWSDDGKQLTLSLRKGVKFGDGTPFTSSSVKATLERAKSLAGTVAAAEIDSVEKIVPVDDHTVRLELSRPDSSLLSGLADHAGMMISERAIEANQDLASTDGGAGSGPFEVQRADLPTSLVLERKPGEKYWDPKAFQFQRMELYNVGDSKVIYNGLLGGTFDVAKVSASVEDAKQTLAGDDRLSFSSLESNVIRSVHLRSTRPAFKDPAVRRAVAEAVDWKSVATKVLDSRYDYADQNFRREDDAYVPGFNPYPFRPKAAGALLKGLQISCVVSSALPDENKIAAVLQETLSSMGAKVTITQTTNAGAIADFAAGKYDMWVQAFGPKGDAAVTMADVFYGNEKLGGPEATDVRAAIDHANTLSLGSPERSKALQQMNRAIAETNDLIPVAALSATWVSSNRIQGVDEHMNTVWASSYSARYWRVTKA